jgi:O-methyltransferase involved in polyketide biosynthesis
MVASKFNKVSETALGTLATRAKHGDPFSKKFFEYLKPIYEEARKKSAFNFPPAIERTQLYDSIVFNYLQKNPKARILNIGCGFCTRYIRLDNGECTWYDCDYDDIIKMRSQVLLPTIRNQYIGCDLSRSFPDVKYDLLIAEGFACYLPFGRVREIIKGHCLFDVFTYNRTQPLGKDQLWKYHPKDWKLNILNSWVFDKSQKREALLLEVLQ